MSVELVSLPIVIDKPRPTKIAYGYNGNGRMPCGQQKSRWATMSTYVTSHNIHSRIVGNQSKQFKSVLLRLKTDDCLVFKVDVVAPLGWACHCPLQTWSVEVAYQDVDLNYQLSGMWKSFMSYSEQSFILLHNGRKPRQMSRPVSEVCCEPKACQLCRYINPIG